MYREIPAEAGVSAGTIIALHGHGGDLDQLEWLCRRAEPTMQVFLAEAKRPVGPHAINRDAEDYEGFTWYLMQEVASPEPASFGDSLQQVEQFVYDVLDRVRPNVLPLFLLGYGQGAVLAWTAGVLLPEYVTGVVGICGTLPEIPGWSLAVEDMGEMPILLVHDPRNLKMSTGRVEKTVEELTRRGAKVGVEEVPGAWPDPLVAAGVLRRWLGIQLVKALPEACRS